MQEALGGSATPAPSQKDLLDSSGASEEMKSDQQTTPKQSSPAQDKRKEVQPKSTGPNQATRKDAEPKSTPPSGDAGAAAKSQVAGSEGEPSYRFTTETHVLSACYDVALLHVMASSPMPVCQKVATYYTQHRVLGVVLYRSS